MFASEMIKI